MVLGWVDNDNSIKQKLRNTQNEVYELKKEIDQLADSNEVLLHAFHDYIKLMSVINKRFPKGSMTRMVIDMFLGDTNTENLKDKLEYYTDHLGIKSDI